MMSFEEIVRKILTSRPDITKEDVFRMVKTKRESAGQLLTEEGAAYMVANDLGVDIVGGSFRTTINLKDLIIGTSDVTVSGRVILTYPTQSFNRKNGALGKVGRFVLQDGTATINIVIWDEKVELLENNKIKAGMNVRVNHGYVRAGLNGRPEVNVGQRGSVVAMSPDQKEDTKFEQHLKKIKDINAEDFLVSFQGLVGEISQPTTFSRSDGRTGRVARLRLGDETGRIRVVLWDDKVGIVESIKKGDALKIMNGRARSGLGNDVEVHIINVSEMARLENVPDDLSTPIPHLAKIRDLAPGLSSVDVLGRVISVGTVRLFERPSGGHGKVGDLTLMDDSGSIRLSLWDDKADIVERVSQGDTILVEAGYTRESSYGTVSLSLGRLGSTTINPDLKEARDLPSYSQDIIPISNLREGLPASIEGIVSEVPNLRQVTTRDGRELTVASLKLRDDTGEIRISLWQENAEKIRFLPLDAKLRIKDAFVRIGFDGDLEVSTRSTTQLDILGSQIDSKPVSGKDITLDQGELTGYNGEAEIVELLDLKVEAVCSTCGEQVVEVDGEFICRECEEACELDYRLTVVVQMEDEEQSKLHATFMDRIAEKLLGMRTAYIQNLISQSEDEEATLQTFRQRLLGKKAKIKGKVTETSGTPLLVKVEEALIVSDQ